MHQYQPLKKIVNQIINRDATQSVKRELVGDFILDFPIRENIIKMRRRKKVGKSQEKQIRQLKSTYDWKYRLQQNYKEIHNTFSISFKNIK